MEGVNKHRLPRLIIILINHDLLHGINVVNKSGVSNNIGRCLTRLTKRLDQIVELKKKDMFYKHTGSLSPNEPKFIWIKMLK